MTLTGDCGARGDKTFGGFVIKMVVSNLPTASTLVLVKMHEGDR
jgi:hypothetical protein